MIARLTVLRNMSIRMKVGMITLLMCIPIASLLYAFLSVRQEAISFASKELLGTEYLQALKPVLEHVPQHRGLMAMYLAGQTDQKERILLLRGTVDADLKAVEAVDQKLGQTLGTTAQLKALNQSWQAIKQRDFDVKPGDSFEQHTQLISDMIALMQQVGDLSNLILDPDLDTYYLMDNVVNKLPDMAEHLGRLRGLGSSIAARKARTLEEQIQLRLLTASVKKSLESVQRNMQIVYRERPGSESKLGALTTGAMEGIEAFIRVSLERIVQAEPVTMPAHEYFAAGTETLSRLTALSEASLVTLQELLQARIAKTITGRNWHLALALGLTVLAFVMASGMRRLLINQVKHIQILLNHIEQGDYSTRAEVLSQDEIGAMAISLNMALDHVLHLVQSQDERDAIQASIMKLLEEVSGVAEGDLRIEAEVTDDVTGAIADSFNYMILQLRNIVTQVQDATLQVSASANEIQVTAEHLAEGSTTQASQILDSSAAIDEMAVSIQQVSENAALSAQVAGQALTNAKQGTTAVHNTIEGMQRIRSQVQETAKRIKRLGERSQEISEIVQLIGDIADRTSILALNASIQAARAGEAGRAFTVVAEEVERLAERSSNATKQIAGLVNTIQGETNEAMMAMEESTREVVQGSRLADQAGQALSEIEEVSAQLAELIQSISLAAKQQARGSESLSQAMGEISDVTQQTAAGTKQAAVSINNLANLADNLRESMSTFKLPANTNEHSRVA